MAWRTASWDGESWREHAACADQDTRTWFPIGMAGAASRQAERAKRVCYSCPVRDECLRFAVTTNQEHGIWGGLDEEERRDVRRGWRRASRRAESA